MPRTHSIYTGVIVRYICYHISIRFGKLTLLDRLLYFKMLRSSFKLFPFALTVAALICLVVVIEGCRSTSSPQDLFFLKVSDCFTPLHA
jgi:hypothetical protein